MKEIWVLVDRQNDVIRGVTYELLGQARHLAAGLNASVAAVSLGSAGEALDSLYAHGADRIYAATLPDGDPDDAGVSALAALIRERQPEIVLAGATSFGSSVMSRAAVAIEAGLSPNCTGLMIDPDSTRLLMQRPAYGGILTAEMMSPQRSPQMATVRPRAFRKPAAEAGRSGDMVNVDLSKEPVSSRTRVMEVLQDLAGKVKLEEADIIVCGGRGVGSPQGFEMIFDLAEALGGVAAATRPPVDDGWIPYAHQVGQTGKTVSPKLYVACGVSGAPQHLAGMQSSEVIVAVNEDPAAPIFDVANYRIVGDVLKIVPLLASKVRALRAG